MKEVCPNCGKRARIIGSGTCYDCAPKPYRCKLCGRGFPSVAGRSGHMSHCKRRVKEAGRVVLPVVEGDQ